MPADFAGRAEVPPGHATLPGRARSDFRDQRGQARCIHRRKIHLLAPAIHILEIPADIAAEVGHGDFPLGSVGSRHREGGITHGGTCGRASPAAGRLPGQEVIGCGGRVGLGRSRRCSRGGVGGFHRGDPFQEVRLFSRNEGGVPTHLEKPCVARPVGDRAQHAAVLRGIGARSKAFEFHHNGRPGGSADGLRAAFQPCFVDRWQSELAAPAVDVGECSPRCATEDNQGYVSDSALLALNQITELPHCGGRLLFPVRGGRVAHLGARAGRDGSQLCRTQPGVWISASRSVRHGWGGRHSRDTGVGISGLAGRLGFLDDAIHLDLTVFLAGREAQKKEWDTKTDRSHREVGICRKHRRDISAKIRDGEARISDKTDHSRVEIAVSLIGWKLHVRSLDDRQDAGPTR